MLAAKNSNIDREYKFWRLRILVGMYLGYTVFYFTRKSLTFISPELLSQNLIDKSTLGLLGTLFYIVYGFSKFFSGILSDKCNPRYFMGVGLILTGIVNISFGYSSSITMFILLWVINGYFQGWGWAPCSKLLTFWYSKSERGTWWSIQSSSHNTGGMLIPIIASISIVAFGWRYGMVIPGVIAIVTGVVIMLILRDKPITLGLPSIGEWRKDKLELEHERNSTPLPTKDILINYVFKNKIIWLLSASYIFVYIIRTAVNDWSNIYLSEYIGFNLLESNLVVSFFEIGGFIGTILAGWSSDFFFKGRRLLVTTVFTVGATAVVFLMYVFNVKSYFLLCCLLFFCGFFIFGPQLLVTIMAAEMSHKDSAGATVGFVSLFGYIGAALSGYPVAIVIEKFSWGGYFTILLGCGLISSLIIASIFTTKARGVI